MTKQLACSPTFEFATKYDNIDDARRELERLWIGGGKQVSAQWSEDENAVFYLNVDRQVD